LMSVSASPPPANPATAAPTASDPFSRVDDGLHFGWAWHRHRYCYRRWDHLRILDDGRSGPALARLNPGSTVLEFDPDAPPPAGAGPFDFIVCRRALGRAERPEVVLKDLARMLDDRGLLLARFPSREGRRATRQLRRAVAVLAPDASDRADVGRELVAALRPEHPIRQRADRPASDLFDDDEPTREYDLAEAVSLVEGAGLRFLYVAAERPWRPDLVFAPGVPASLQQRVGALSERDQSLLIDALDPTRHGDSYRVYACPADFEPRQPGWPDEMATKPESFDRLIPHRTGLAEPTALDPDPATARGRVSFRVVTGVVGEIDRRSRLLFDRADGATPIAEIDRSVFEATGSTEAPETRRARWLDLADHGFIALESPDPRQHVDCIHLGPIRDRLDCPCPRRWVRDCERHVLCTIDNVNPTDPQAPALAAALGRLGLERAMACEHCPDYQPDE
jgi:hypothetical protein